MSISKQHELRRTEDQYRGENDNGIDRETAYQALSNQRRRFIIHYLLQEGGPIPLRALSKQVAAWENAIPRDRVTSKQRKRVYTALHQAHLPKLDKMGIIEYDTREMIAHPTEKLGTLRAYMEVVPKDEIPWSVCYVGTALVFGVGAVLGWHGTLPFDVLPGHVWALVVSLTVIAMGVTNIYRESQYEFEVERPPPEVDRIDSS